MSRYKFQLQPAGSLPRDLKLRLALPNEVTPVAPATPPEQPVTPVVFCGWDVTTVSGYTLQGPFRVHEDAPYWVIGYKDQDFEFLIQPLCDPPAELTWSYEDTPSGLPDLAVVPESGVLGGSRLIHDSHSTSYADSSIKVTALLDGTPWGVPIYFSEGGKFNPRYLYIWEPHHLVWPSMTVNYGATADSIALPPTACSVTVNYFGPLQPGEDVVFTPVGAPAELNMSTYDGGSAAGGEGGHIDSASIGLWLDYDAGLDGTGFTVEVTTSVSGIALPTLTFDITGTHTPMSYAEPADPWGIRRINGSGVDETPVDTYPQFTETTFNQFALHGYYFGDPDDITWTVTQIAGPARTLTVTRYFSTVWQARRAAGQNYAGTAYQLQAMLGGTAFGDVVTIGCEV